ncbi:disulfide bond formation protein B [Rhizobium sp. RU36D]|uniref:disulfide bond formation protein B n=1 Tax=Rhizobium sp. RU36D TaxID=1907415 RepID=UPI0009D7C4AC|nr:disulfide bond formation protein B [Rhizobium sp. RU36D]SMC77982.1 Disulfide bond formation protein DsbB [Rhizobium sp. RU36D]
MQTQTVFNRLNMSLLTTLGMAVTVGSALGFEHIGGYIPCALCLMQRTPYYIGIPVGILAILAAALKLPAWVSRLLLLAIALLMIWSGGLGVYHSGVEWQFWEGPASCSISASGVSAGGGDILAQLNSVKGPSCTEATLRVLGLSFAGWNVLASAVLATLAIIGVRAKA